MFHNLLILLSLIASNAYGVFAVTLTASMLNQLGYNNASSVIYIENGNDIDDIDLNAFKGYTQLTNFTFYSSKLRKMDLEILKDTKIQQIDFSGASLTQFTNTKKITFPSLQRLVLLCPLASLDSNVINGTPNLTIFVNLFNQQLSALKTNQLSQWKKLQVLEISSKNQSSLTKEHFNGLTSLYCLSFPMSKIKTVEVHTLLALPNLTIVDLSNNELTSFEYLQIPSKLEYLDLQGNKMNYFMLSRTMGFVKQLYLENNQFRSFKSMDFTFLANLTELYLGNNPHAYPNELPSQMAPLVNLKRIGLSSLSINFTDANFFKQNTKLEFIYLYNNKISVIPFNTFSHLKSLYALYMSNNQISFLDNRTFVGLDLNFIDLQSNRLAKINFRTFYNLFHLFYVQLSNNLISEIDSSAFSGCFNLREIHLDGNRLTKLSPRTFDGLWLNKLILNNNQLTVLDNLTFAGMSINYGIQYFDISYNNISIIRPGTFNSLNISETILLHYNLLTTIENDTFAGQNQLSRIILNNNKIFSIEAGAFNGLTNLKEIHLENNNITHLDDSTFAGCNNLVGIYLNNNPNLEQSNLQSLCATAAVNCQVYL